MKPDPAVIAAWEKSGFRFRWMGMDEYHVLGWRESSVHSVDDIPGFRLDSGSLSESVRGLAQPDAPFAVSVFGGDADDAGLKELARLKQLQTLYLRNTQVTRAGLEELKKALPNCKIY